jgi:two-component system, chemotaxis family, response regulator PixG
MIGHLQSPLSNYLLHEFKTCTQLQYSGKLEIKSQKGHKWVFYYRLGRIVWAGGGTHPGRRCRRNIAYHCPEINIEKIQLPAELLAIEQWDYRLLEILYKKDKINRQQVNSIVDSTISELLFDLAQQTNFTDVICQRNQGIILDAPMSLSSTDVSLRHLHDLWQSWSEAGLAKFSPDFAPILRQPEQLKQIVSPTAYENFVKFMKGKYTLRDLAIKMKLDLLSISRSLLPYILRGIIELVEIPDLSFQVSKKPQPLKQNAPLIACVDDSLQVCNMLEQIITANGMRFVGIQNPLEILSTLIERKPDIIFLDLIMPVTSGYEICSQLRRISIFADTPVVILTGSDGLFDRVRAKVVGSSDFITKPVIADKVMDMLQKYLRWQQPVSHPDFLIDNTLKRSEMKLSYV